jgi:ATP-dependent DNA helicase RecQ
MCYVLPALLAGRTLVISPLIALMQDQVESLRANGVAAGFINSSLTRAQKNQVFLDFRDGRLHILYVAPESLANNRFVDLLGRAGVRLLAIDEAHCVSDWGHDFRPDYLMLGSVRERLGSPRTLALTATADPRVRDDIARRLGIEHAERVVTSVDRPNLRMAVEGFSRLADKDEWLLAYLNERPGQSGIVYARSRRKVEELAELLASQGIKVAGYHAGMAPEVRAVTQRNFTTGRVPVIVATNAFGMGVNKPDVRFVVHYDMPGRLEAYYQEAGRAGRDGEPAECTLLYHRRARVLPQTFIDEAHPSDTEVRKTWHRLLSAYSLDGDAPPVFSDDLRDASGYAMALRALRESGLVDERGMRLLSSDPNAPVDTTVIAQHKQYAELKLDQMVEYAESGRCRKAAVLRYFGEQSPANCGSCDVCTPAAPEAPPFFPEDLFRSLLEYSNQMAELSGTRPGSVLPYRSAQELATYRPKNRDALLETWGIQRRRADRIGADVLRIVTDWEKRHPGAPPPPVRQRREWRGSYTPAAPAATVDNTLFQKLREWRSERASKDSVPAFTVFWDRTLAELARVRPGSMTELAGVFGMGAAKVRKYGAELLAVINAR